MANKKEIKSMLSVVTGNADVRLHNARLLSIYRGGLLPFIVEALKRQLSGQSLQQACERIAPINVLQRIIDKQSKIYAGGVSRAVIGGTDNDKALLSYYEKAMRPSRSLAHANGFFNLFKNCLIQPYLSMRDPLNPKPKLRVIPSSKFIPFSTDENERENPTGFIIFKETREKLKQVAGSARGKKVSVDIWYMITADEYCYFDSDGDDWTEYYTPAGSIPGVNELGRVPYVYINRDEDSVIPSIDTDVLPMATLIPVLLTDVNFAHMFSHFSIIYTMNLEDKGIVYAPNALWSFKSPPGDEAKAQIGTLDPHSDISGSLQLIANQFGLWLNCKGLKPGAIGEISASNFSSGVAKMLDEMDSSEDRKEQVPFFADGEADMWDLILNYLHPYWVSQGLRMTERFTNGAEVVTNFAEQIPLVRRGAVVDEQLKELGGGLTTLSRALRRINPEMSETEIETLAEEIRAEKTENAPSPVAPSIAPEKKNITSDEPSDNETVDDIDAD